MRQYVLRHNYTFILVRTLGARLLPTRRLLLPCLSSPLQVQTHGFLFAGYLSFAAVWEVNV
jgi:hypothetical protein